MVGQHVDHGTEGRGGVPGRVGLALAGQEPLPWAAEQTSQLAARERDRFLSRRDRDGRVGELAHPPPADRVRGGDQRPAVPVDRVGQPGQPTGRLVPQGRRRLGIGAGPTQFRDQGGQGQRPARTPRHRHHPSPELGQEAGRLVALPLGAGHRGDHEPPSGPGAGDVEQPPLLGDPGRGRLDLAQPVRAEPVRLEQRTPPPDVGPHALLDAGHHDQVPLQPLGAVGGQQPHRRPPQVRLAEGVGGDLLALHLGQEAGHPPQSGDLLGAVGDVEQGADRVQVPVGPPARLSTDSCVLAQPLRPAGARPQHPERPPRPSRRRRRSARTAAATRPEPRPLAARGGPPRPAGR